MGYNKCCVPGCKSRYGRGVLLRGFPKSKYVSEKWLEWFQQWPEVQITSNSAVCELHFSSLCFEMDRVDGKRKLKHNAVPSSQDPLRKISDFLINPSSIAKTERMKSQYNVFGMEGFTDRTEAVIDQLETAENSQNECSTRHVVLDHSYASKRLSRSSQQHLICWRVKEKKMDFPPAKLHKPTCDLYGTEKSDPRQEHLRKTCYNFIEEKRTFKEAPKSDRLCFIFSTSAEDDLSDDLNLKPLLEDIS